MEIKPRATPHYIAVEGPIGVGKTVFASRLAAALDYDVLLEPKENNPFLGRFYQQQYRAALPAQLFFLFERTRLLEGLHQKDLFQPSLVTNFIIEKDHLYANICLDKDELELYENIHNHLIIDTPTPDLVIYLQAPADVLMQRIARRGIKSEQGIEPSYLGQLTRAYTEFFHYYDACQLLIVNAGEIDLTDNTDDLENLVQFIRSMGLGRQYYNPKQATL